MKLLDEIRKKMSKYFSLHSNVKFNYHSFKLINFSYHFRCCKSILLRSILLQLRDSFKFKLMYTRMMFVNLETEITLLQRSFVYFINVLNQIVDAFVVSIDLWITFFYFALDETLKFTLA